MIRATVILGLLVLAPGSASAALALAGDPLPPGAVAVELRSTILDYHLRITGGPVTASSGTEFTITGPWAGSFELTLLDAAVDEVAITSIPSPALPGTLTHVVAPHTNPPSTPHDAPVGTTFTYMLNSVSDPAPDAAVLVHPPAVPTPFPHFDAFSATVGVTTAGTSITSWQFDLTAAHSPEPGTILLSTLLASGVVGHRLRRRKRQPNQAQLASS